ncbi:MAG TPA: LysR family transcriptional regulator [Myxococcales bacterium]|nr:LysR family transcriptional regulator [Myxococcales bacterium]
MAASFADLQLFCRIVEMGSLRAAAAESGLDPSQVTRRLSALEARVGARLITRSRVRSTATEAGRRYYQEMKALLERLESVEREVAGIASEPRGLLRVEAPSVFGARYVAPWLHELQERWPQVSIALVLVDRALDLVEHGIDVAVRIGPLPDSSLTALRLGTMKTVVVGAPGYLARAGVPRTPADLERHRFVLHSGQLQDERLELQGPGQRKATVECRSAFTVSSILGVSEAVRAGAGLNAGPLWLYAPALEREELVRVLPGWSPPAFPVQALAMPGPYRTAKVEAAMRLLREKVVGLPGVAGPQT